MIDFDIGPNAITLTYKHDEMCWVQTDEPNKRTSNVPDVASPTPTLCLYYGEMEEGKPNGHGRLSISPMSNSYHTQYEGYWKNGRYNGVGKLVSVFSSYSYSYKGHFKDGYKHGYAEEEIYGVTKRGYWIYGEYIGDDEIGVEEMSKQKLQMKYHPAKKEVEFKRIVGVKELNIGKDSKLSKYMDSKGLFVLQDHGNGFFDDIAIAFDGEESVEIDVITTKDDYEDFLEMIDYYNEDGKIKITANLLSELPNMNEVYNIVRGHGEKAIGVLKNQQVEFFNVPTGKGKVKECAKNFSDDLKREIENIKDKLDAMVDNNVNICFAGVYSAGKSALINAIIGYKILPENINSKTARMCKIKSPKKNEQVRIKFDIRHEFSEIIWNDKKATFDFIAGPNENQARADLQNVINNVKERLQHEQIYEILTFLNSNDNIGNNVDVFFPIPLDTEYVQFTIYDTPGTDSNYSDHQKVLEDALSAQTHSILIFVVAPNKLEGEGNKALLNYLKNAEKKDNKTSIDIGRSLFVINWADSLDSKSREELKMSEIKDKDDSKLSIKLCDKKVFFTSAMYGYSAAAVKNNVATNEEKYIIEDDLNKVLREGRGRYFLENQVATSEFATKKIIEKSNKALKVAEENNDNLEIFHVCSGMYSLEDELLNYAEKYASAVRAFSIIDSVDKALKSMNTSAKSLEMRNIKDIQEVESEIEILRNTIINGIKSAYEEQENKNEKGLDLALKLDLDRDSLYDNYFSKVTLFIEKLIKIGFWGKARYNEDDKLEIVKYITTVLNDFTADYYIKRNRVIEEARDEFIQNVKLIIQNNGELSEEAKEFMVNINKPSIHKLEGVAEFGDIYSEKKFTQKILWFKRERIDVEEFIKDTEVLLSEIIGNLITCFIEEFDNELNSVLNKVENEFTSNVEKYSVILKAKLDDKEALEKLRIKILDTVGALGKSTDELNEIIWSVKEDE